MEATPAANPGDVGLHNADLVASTTRIIEGGSWKHQRVVVIIPSGPTIPARVALSHWGLIFPPNQPVHRIMAQGCEVGDAYSRAIDEVLAHLELSKWEYILTLESDNTPPPDGLVRLLKRMEERPDLHVIGGLYWTKGAQGVPQIWGDVKDPIFNFRAQPPRDGELVECCGTGMGFNLWRISMFKDLAARGFERPWFKTCASAEEGSFTQDLYFFNRARPLGVKAAVDCGCKVGHYDHEGKFGPPGVVW